MRMSTGKYTGAVNVLRLAISQQYKLPFDGNKVTFAFRRIKDTGKYVYLTKNGKVDEKSYLVAQLLDSLDEAQLLYGNGSDDCGCLIPNEVEHTAYYEVKK